MDNSLNNFETENKTVYGIANKVANFAPTLKSIVSINPQHDGARYAPYEMIPTSWFMNHRDQFNKHFKTRKPWEFYCKKN